ncbi:MAG: SusD/RagB family nutrient-binding outer membrane lipoprotein [Saprospiraceae bacterium]|nr:SusD/RagB family nutrient-binding outer membrane lipoprotein [Saprospiraceae bacterium]
MRKLIYLFTLGTLVLGLTSCDDFLDVNDDPNKSSSAEAGPIFTGAITGYSTNRVIDLGPAVSTAGQMWSGGGSLGAGVFTNPERYNFSIFTTGNTWRSHYRDIQKDLALAIRNSEESGQTNAIAQCKIISAMTYWTTTVLWGDVPFSEAIDVDFDNVAIRNLNPAFDPQEQVLEGVLDLLDESLELIDEGAPTAITSGDLIFKGDMDKWRKFAKSLKLRTLLTMVDADPSKSTDIAALVDEGDLIESSDENAAFPFFAEAGNRNPFWETLNAFAGASNFFYFAGKTMVDEMVARNDPRLEVYFDKYPGGGSSDTIQGAPAGVTDIGYIPWVLSTAPVGTNGTNELVRPNSVDVLFSVQESQLLQAEAMARGFGSGGLAGADSKLRMAITNAMQSYGIDQANIDGYLNNEIPDLTSLTPEEAVEIIAVQHWIDCVIRPVEGWTSWRRNEYPALNLPEGAATADLFRRLPLPPDEIAANDNAPDPEAADVPMWFDK